MSKRFWASAVTGVFMLQAVAAQAQDEAVYIQLLSRSSLASAQQSVRDYTGTFDNVNGFAAGNGWYVVALGPYNRAEAVNVLAGLRGTGQIPGDAYVEEASDYGQQFWPVGAQAARAANEAQAAGAAPQVAQAPAADPQPQPAPVIRDETPREARASERLLTRAERDGLQIALQWAGFYTAAIDGAFGPGTRRAMGEWQVANGFDVTGVLTTMQRAELLRQYNAVLDGLDMQVYADAQAGISMQMPMGAVQFASYEAPFAIFEPSSDPAARVLLISQPGDRQRMNGLYEIMQTLEIVPLEGERRRDRDRFLLTGANDRIVSHTEVSLRNGEIKGFSLIWPAGDEERRSRVLALMQQSFERQPGVLDPASVSDNGQAVDLVSGLKVRKPRENGSGFFIDRAGHVMTSAALVENCARVTLNGVYEMGVQAIDGALGVAVLRPETALAPQQVAAFQSQTPRLQSDVAVAGYSFGGRLSAPTMTFGTLEDLQGLGGEDQFKRLALSSLPGDAGGPVLDAGGGVVGMLLPRDTSGSRQLPDSVSFAAKAEGIQAFLRSQGIVTVATPASATLAPEDLTAKATAMTVLVNCWD
ncbi:MAG: trypsin-like peptidase domain-containing protein [Paracoccaceae bacterium]|nr:trypsin-like peptidase domain-containing protein [Paracoccaceae bacterium]